MYESSFLKRLWALGLDGVIKSLDFIVGVAVTLVILYIFDGSYPVEESTAILDTFISTSSALFAIILTGLAIILSFSDAAFIYAWKEKVEGFEDMVTVFQFNLYLPVFVLTYSLTLKYIHYNGVAMVVLIGLFVYMLVSLIDVVNFLAKYGLQRAEFITQQINREANAPEAQVSEEELRQLLIKLKRTEAKLEEENSNE